MEQTLKLAGIYKWAELLGYKVTKVSYSKSFARDVELEKNSEKFSLNIADITSIPSTLVIQGKETVELPRDFNGYSLSIQPVEAELIEQNNGKVFDTLKITKQDYLQTLLAWKKETVSIDELVNILKSNKANKDLSKSIKAFIQLIMLKGFESFDFKLNDASLESFKRAVIKYVLEYNETNSIAINITSFESTLKSNLINVGILKPFVHQKKKSYCQYWSTCPRLSSCMYAKCQFRPVIDGEPYYIDSHGEALPLPLKKIGIYKWAELKGYTNLKVNYTKGQREVSFYEGSIKYSTTIDTLDTYIKSFTAYPVIKGVVDKQKPKEFSGVEYNDCLFIVSSSMD